MAETDNRPATPPTTPAQPADAGRFTYHDADREQSDLEGLLEEKGDFQEAVDAQQRGERPSESGGSTMP